MNHPTTCPDPTITRGSAVATLTHTRGFIAKPTNHPLNIGDTPMPIRTAALARLIRPDGTVEREWQTSQTELALTADRNYPPFWRVEIAA